MDKMFERTEIPYVGVGTSTFQSEPLPRGREVLSDWGYWTARQRDIDQRTLPHFSEKFLHYTEAAQRIGSNVFRFSLEPELVPEPGTFDERVMEEYAKRIVTIRLSGMEPFITLNHYTLPLYLTRLERYGGGGITRTGWTNPHVLDYFRTLTEGFIGFLSDSAKMRRVFRSMLVDEKTQERLLTEGVVHYVMTINEPLAAAEHGNVFGIFPPHRKGRIDLALRSLRRMVAAHDIAYAAIKEAAEKRGWKVNICIGYNWQYHTGPVGAFFRSVDHFVSDLFERDGRHTDFVGLQYYCWVNHLFSGKKEGISGRYLDWGSVYPEGVFSVLTDMSARYEGKPIWITEFGFSDAYDLCRPRWILETIRFARRAQIAGVPLEGVLLWTLAHNVEWARGMKEHFGFCDEAELPLLSPRYPSTKEITSAEAFRTAAQFLRTPSTEAREEMQRASLRAAKQCGHAL